MAAGPCYGTILVDLSTHRVVDPLPDRSAASVAAWLAQHPTITVVCRDRSPLYADGIRQGVPNAVQAVSLTLVCPAAKRSQDAQTYVEQLCQVEACIARAYALIHTFLSMVRERWGDDLEAWMAEATHSGIAELARFDRGL